MTTIPCHLNGTNLAQEFRRKARWPIWNDLDPVVPCLGDEIWSHGVYFKKQSQSVRAFLNFELFGCSPDIWDSPHLIHGYDVKHGKNLSLDCYHTSTQTMVVSNISLRAWRLVSQVMRTCGLFRKNTTETVKEYAGQLKTSKQYSPTIFSELNLNTQYSVQIIAALPVWSVK